MEHNDFNFIPHIGWSSIDSSSIRGYHNKTLNGCVILFLVMLICNEVSYNNSDNKLPIYNTYICIIKDLCDSSHNFLPVPAMGTTETFQPTAGCNDYVKAAQSGRFILLWQSNSKARF